MKKPIAVVVLGRSGCGKGEQIKLLEKKLKPALVIHTGALFRAFIHKPTLAAGIAKKFLQKGNLAPTWLASYMWIDALMRGLDFKKNIIFDGSPRMLGEAKLLDDVLAWFSRKRVIAVYIHISEKETIKRLLMRGREDDHALAIKNRLAFFKHNVLPAINYYRSTKRIIFINGEQSIKRVSNDICKALGI
ncbi:MAG: nucleoside monophosphate kinase [Patescibacteria group bacterium]